MLDVDHFKSFNDRFGHPAGDAALTAVARAIAQTVRGIDAAGRYGGEEFIVLLAEADADAAAAALNRIRAAVAALAPPRIARSVTLSAGVAVHQALFETTSLDSLVARADAALYEAKRAGRDRVALEATPEPATPADVRYR
jgi:diguanylate cyclase (GGDEF)-like protein